MSITLLNAMRRFIYLPLLLALSWSAGAQTTVFSADFTTSQGTQYTTTNGPIGGNTTWSLLRSGTDFGGGINAGILSLINDSTGAFNSSGWAMNYTNAAAFGAPYSTTLNNNAGPITWTFNMRQVRTDPSGLAQGYYGVAFIVAGTSNTTATTGSGYAVVLGQTGTTDPLRLVRYTAGLRTSTNIITSNTSGLADFGNQYLSVRVVYTPLTQTWQLYVRNDGTTPSVDPSSGVLTLQGSVVNNPGATAAFPLLGAFWNAGIVAAQRATFDNIKVTVALPVITSITPSSKVAGTGSFPMTVNGSNFSLNSVVRWNGVNLATTFNTATQLTATIPAANISAAGNAAVTVATGNAISNSLPFTIDPAGVPSIATSVNTLSAFSTITGTASNIQNFTTSGNNLTGNITITSPTGFEVSLATGGPYTTTVTVPATSTTVYTRVAAGATAGLYAGNINLTTPGGAAKQVAVSATVFSAEPTTSATGVSFSNTTSISTTVSWANGNGARHLVIVRAGSAVNSTPTDGSIYNASGAFGTGTEIGSGNYVAYNGTSNTFNLTGLSAATTYYVSVYEFNGSGGTENYKINTPALGSKLTLNAPLGLQVTTTNTSYIIDFDNTVEGVNNGTYGGGGINTAPDDGELNSNSFSFNQLTTGAVTFGGQSTEDSPAYGNGSSTGGVTEGGFYAFEVSENNYSLGIQPTTGDYASGSTTLRFQNQTGGAITSLSVGYKVYVYNDEDGSNSYNFLHSSDNISYTAESILNLSTPAIADSSPEWKAYYKVITLTGLNIANNGYYYFRWNDAPVSGTAYDEIALDDISIVANPTTTFAAFEGTAETFMIAGITNLNGNVTVNGNITFNNGKAILGSNTLTLNGTVTNTIAGGIRGSGTSNLIMGGGVNSTVSFDQTTPGTTNMLNNFSIATTSANTITLGNNVTVSGTLNVNEFQTLNIGANTLMGALTTITNVGTITTQNTSTAPFAANKTWGGSGVIILNATTTAQYLPAGIYNKVTVSTTGGATATGNITLKGDLNLPNANPSSVKGSFDTATFTLTMTPSSSNTGVGDVSGIITRNAIANNILYTFGHPLTEIIIPPIGTLPSSLSIKTILGSAPANKPDGILRTYEFIQTGASGTKAFISAHYLDSELNGNTESKLVDWVVQLSPIAVIEQGRSNYNTTDNFVQLGNVDLGFFSSSFGAKQLTLANSQVATSVWNGSVSSSWTTAANWTPAATPSDATKVIIPDASTTPRAPDLNASVTIGSLSIDAGGILNAPTGSQLTITGTSGAWINNGTFNASTGNVTFNASAANAGDATIAGTTTFNNLTVPAGSNLRVLTNNVMTIGGTFTKAGNLFAGSVENTVIYSGTNQTIAVPNGLPSAYHNLTLNGTGAVLPASLNITGDLTTNAVIDFSGKTITMLGLLNEDQAIGGAVPPVLDNLIINKPSAFGDVILQSNIAVSGTLTLTSGILDIGNYNLTLGSNPIAGTFSDTTMIEAEDNGVVRRPFTGPGSYLFPIGEGTSNTTYSPIRVDVTGATSFNNGYISVNVKDAIHPNDNSTGSYLTRYWNVTPTGITNAVASITANYRIGDAVGGESSIIAAQLDGSFNVITNPWQRFGTLSATTLTANAILTNGQTSSFTGIKEGAVIAEITGEGSFCQNTPVILSAQVTNGQAPYIYRWSDGLGAGSTATPLTNTVGTRTYTLIVTDANGISSTDTADITITGAPVAGTATGNQTICANTVPNPVTLTGYTGTIVRWERSTTTAFTNPAFIASTSPTLTGAEIGSTLTSTRYVRAIVQNGSCDGVPSNAVEIKVNTTTWNGTAWSNGLPTAADAVVFTGDYNATANIDACTITVENGATVNVPTGFTATVNGAVTVTSGSFTIQNNAALVQLTEAVNSGNITVIKNSNPLYRLDYTLWSSPVAGQSLINFSPNTISNRFYEYGVVNNQEHYIAISNTSIFNAAKAYLIRMPDQNAAPGYNDGSNPYTFPGIFTGRAHNGTITTPASSLVNRYTAVGNPYPSPISVADFFAANSAVLDGGSGIYFWRKKNNSASSSYATLTLAAYTSNSGFANNSAAGGGAEQAVYFTGNESNWLISQGQGFLVRTAQGATGNVTFNNVMRRPSPGASQSFFRTAADTASRYWLNLSDGQDGFSQVAVAYLENATTGIDFGYDGRQLLDGGRIALYSIAENNILAIQARPTFTDTDSVQMGYLANAAGQYTIGIDHQDGLFEQGQAIYLRDNLLGVYHNLNGGVYSFASEAGTFNDRFEIVYISQALGINVPELDANSVVVFKDGKTINVSSVNNIIRAVIIYDVRGRVLYKNTDIDIDAQRVLVSDLNAAQEVLIVEVATDKGKMSKRIIY
jgi:hypothetical protein